MSVFAQCEQAMKELCQQAKLRPMDEVVVGCSTSEVVGQRIGSAGSLEVARELISGLQAGLAGSGAVLCVQCCEHLNRAIVLPRNLAEARQYQEVCVMPQIHAGGSLATAYYQSLQEEACVVEGIQARAGLDIGDTLIGMQLRRVAVPLRLSLQKIGEAHLVAAYTRPPLIGGARAQYPDMNLR